MFVKLFKPLVMALVIGGSGVTSVFAAPQASEPVQFDCAWDSSGKCQNFVLGLSMTFTEDAGAVTLSITNNSNADLHRVHFDMPDDQLLVLPSSTADGFDVKNSEFPLGGKVTHGFDSDLALQVKNASSAITNVSFQLASGKTFADVESALANGDLRVGLHFNSVGMSMVSAMDTGSISPLPEPSAYAMMLLGLGMIGYVAHRRRV